MKKIHFENLKPKERTAGSIVLASVLIIVPLISTFLFFNLDEENKKHYQLVASLAGLSVGIFIMAKTILKPNYISWTGSYMNTRLSFWFPKQIMSNEVIEVTQSDRKITFWKRYDEQIEIDLKDYSTDDIEKFKQILSENLRSKAHFRGKPSWIQSQKLTS